MMPSDEERIPHELIDKWTGYLPASRVALFRKTCAETNMQHLETALRPFFATCKTSLIGSSLETLRSISNDERIRSLVEILIIADDSEQLDPWASSELPSLHGYYEVWPRNDASHVLTSDLAVSELRPILYEKLPQLRMLKIRDYSISPINFRLCDEMLRVQNLLESSTPLENRGPVPVASFAKHLLEDVAADIVLTCLDIQHASLPHSEGSVLQSPRFKDQIETSVLGGPKIYEATLGFVSHSLQRQQKDLQQFSLLNSTRLRLGGDDPTTAYWLEKVFSSAGLLQTLELTFTSSTPLIARERAIVPRLEDFTLSHTTTSAQDILTMLSASKASLIATSFRQVTLLNDESTWDGLLSSIAADFPALTTFHLSVLREKARGSSAINFLSRARTEMLEELREGLVITEKGTGSNRRVTTVDYRGVKAGLVLRVLAGGEIL